MKLIIIGAGIAGAVAYNALKSYSPAVFTAEEETSTGLKRHKAIMRIRDPKLGLLVGCDLAPITIQKMMLYEGKLHHQSNITASNLYSLKIYNGINHQSIDNLESAKRYLITSDIKIDNCRYGYKLIDTTPGSNVLSFNVGSDIPIPAHAEYDYCISTIPLPTLAKVCRIEVPSEIFQHEPIYVYRAKLQLSCHVNQTIYIPEHRYFTYRVTLQQQEIIFECVEEMSGEEREELLVLFGLSGAYISPIKLTVQPRGKIYTSDDDYRKKVIWEITEKFNIFSFGRFGIWKPLRADHLLNDIEKIKTMINLRESGRNYEYEKAKTNEEA